MGIIVCKFGGSSAADADGFRRIREIVESNPDRRYIVLSAPGRRSPSDEKITDLLLSAHREIRTVGTSPSLCRVRQRFEALCGALRLPPDENSRFLSSEISPHASADAAASRGEYFCARLFARYADLPFADASEFVLFDEFGNFLREATFDAIRQMSRRLPRAVIPGFYGSMPDGRIKTFSRGGSDITGALIAAALDADLFENWTDVDGLMSADPAVCPDAVHHIEVSYRQMLNLSRAGASVLHPCCLEPVRKAGIPTVIKNTFRPDAEGTFIRENAETQVRCICARRNQFARLLSPPDEPFSRESAEIFRNFRGEPILVLPHPFENSVPACALSIFGLPAECRTDAMTAVPALGFSAQGECLKILIPSSDEIPCTRRLHRILIQKNREASTSRFD